MGAPFPRAVSPWLTPFAVSGESQPVVKGIANTRLLWLSLAGVVVAAAAGAAVLYFFDPATVAIYPVCYFHRITGLLCPGCGGLRAAHQLLHGNLGAALRLNALAVLAAPLLGWLCLRFVFHGLRRRPATFALPTAWLWVALGLLIVFGIARNVVG